jgi:hypothetical protein
MIITQGSHFVNEGETYLFARIGNCTFTLIELEFGNRWDMPIDIPEERCRGNKIELTENEMYRLFGSGIGTWVTADGQPVIIA